MAQTCDTGALRVNVVVVVFFSLSQKLVHISESVHGKNLTMFSFEGDFRRRPKVSLGGASKKASVISLYRDNDA